MTIAGKITKRHLFLALGAVALAASIVLAVLQYRWIRDSNRAERDRDRRSLVVSIERALEEFGSELRTLLSFALLPPGESSDGPDLSRIAESVDLWDDQADAPTILSSLYAALPATGEFYEFNDGVFRPVDVPEVYAMFLDAPDERSPHFAPDQPPSLLADGVIVFTYPIAGNSGDASPESPSEPAGYLIIELDLFVLLNERLPFYMETYLPGYSYRIVRGERTRYVYGTVDFSGREPDLRFPFFSPLLSRTQWSLSGLQKRMSQGADGEATPGDRSDPAGEDQARRIPADPTARFWYFRVNDLVGLAGTGHDHDPEEPQSLILEIYAPHAPFDVLSKRRMIGDLAISYGFITLFLIALFGLFRVYLRSEEYRAREREFVSAMSHELGTPVSVIRSIAENLADGVALDAARLSEYGALVREQTHRLGRMVESILMVSGLNRNGAVQIEWTAVEVSSLVDDVLRVLDPTAGAEGIALVRSGETVRTEFLTDPVALRLVLENLVMNAIKHAKRGVDGETISVRAAVYSDLDAGMRRLRGRLLRIIVDDRGPGIAPREQKRVFEAFYRGESSRRNQTPGSGLGLHLVRRVLGMLGGTVLLESPYVEGGATVRGVRVIVDIPEAKEPGRVG